MVRLKTALIIPILLLLPSAASADTVVVGDSLGYGTVPYLHARSAVYPGMGSPWAVDQLKRLDTPQTDAIVFDAGTNDASLDILGRSLWELLKVAHGRPVVLLTTSGYIGPDWRSIRRLESAKNRMIRSLKGGNIHVIKWRRYALENNLLADGVHATSAGYQVRAKLIQAELRSK